MRKNKFMPAIETLNERVLPGSVGLVGSVVPLPAVATDPTDPIDPPVYTATVDSGDDPPITQPPLPSTGPSGPGSSS